MINGLPVQALAGHDGLKQLAAGAEGDRVLVLVQLHGGNDGLNTLVPLNQYDVYKNQRPNIALPRSGNRRLLTLDSQRPDNQQLGIHPDMQSFQRLYDDAQVSIVQSVAYDNFAGSHFRSRDVMFMGGGGNDSFDSGWGGRYLNSQFPGYPDAYPSEAMADPLAIEIGSSVSLAFHGANGISTSVAVSDPEKFIDLISQVGSSSTASSGNGYYDQELNHIINVELRANKYAQRLADVYSQGKNGTISYPEKYTYGGRDSYNELSGQLKTVARLLSGGSKTKIFLARIGGFDTHALQVENNDPTRGKHASLLYNLFGAVEAFQKDLRQLGIEDRVMTFTFSEFGRRVASNAGQGTDHGTAAPFFVFGKHVKPGIIGTNPDLSDLDRGNLKYQYDYRQVVGTLLKDWLRADGDALSQTRLAAFTKTTLPIVGGVVPPPVSKSDPKPSGLINGIYMLRSVSTGKLVEVAAAGGSGDNVRLGKENGGKNQRWQITMIRDKYYRLTSVQNLKMSMDAYRWGKESGTNVQVWSSAGGQSNQEWRLVGNEEGQYRFAPYYLDDIGIGMSITVGGDSDVYLSRTTKKENQLFTLERVEDNARVDTAPITKKKVATTAAITELTVYPNPFVDKLYVHSPTRQPGVVEVKDALGRSILRQPLDEAKTTLRLNGLVKGIYYVTVEQAGEKTTEKMIKK